MAARYPDKRLPHHVAVIGAAGGLGQGILRVCRAEGIAITAIVRSRPERILDVPQGSRVAVVTSLADRASLTKAFSETDVVLTALGVTPTSNDRQAMLSANATEVEAAMLAAGVDRIIIINTLLVSPPGKPSHSLFLLDARQNRPRCSRATRGRRRARQGRFLIGSVDTSACRTQLSRQRRASRGRGGLAWRSELLDASLVRCHSALDDRGSRGGRIRQGRPACVPPSLTDL